MGTIGFSSNYVSLKINENATLRVIPIKFNIINLLFFVFLQCYHFMPHENIKPELFDVFRG